MTALEKRFRPDAPRAAGPPGVERDLTGALHGSQELRAGDAHRDVRKIDLVELLRSTARLHGWGRSPCTDFELSVSEHVPTLTADRPLLEELVGRLICQAMDSVGDGWGTITLSAGLLGQPPGPIFEGGLSAAPTGDPYAYLEVYDTGGFPEGRFDDPVSEPFRSPRYPGDPLSLSDARQRIEARGGRILLENIPGGSTSVLLLLPCTRGRA